LAIAALDEKITLFTRGKVQTFKD